MKTFAIKRTSFLEEYLQSVSRFHTYEIFEDCFILQFRTDEQIFWFGYGYHKYLSDKA